MQLFRANSKQNNQAEIKQKQEPKTVTLSAKTILSFKTICEP